MAHTAWFLLLLAVSCTATPKLETYFVDKSSISISGLSSGGCFAVQFHVTYSELIVGAAVIAGVPYYCARNDLQTALNACMKDPALVDVATLVNITQTAAAESLIDDPKNMENDKVYLFSGTLDTVVAPGTVEKLAEYYGNFLTGPHASLQKVFTMPAEHSIVTDGYGNACATLATPFINNCSYSTAYHLLQQIYGDIVPADASDAIPQNLLEYDQAEFFPNGPDAASMDTVGYVYVPTACQRGTTACRLHVAFHGCLEGRMFVSNTYALNAGYVQVAEKNNIIVLLPQVTNLMPNGTNPNGCWDWWGYTGENYAFNTGHQILGVRFMVNRVAGLTPPNHEATQHESQQYCWVPAGNF